MHCALGFRDFKSSKQMQKNKYPKKNVEVCRFQKFPNISGRIGVVKTLKMYQFVFENIKKIFKTL